MTRVPPKRARRAAGLTLLEMSIVIGVLLSLIAVTFVGTRAWKDGADRASCIVNIRNVQMAVRSYQNMHGYDPGDTARVWNGSQSITEHLHGREFLTDHVYNQVRGADPCPGGGSYSVANDTRFPLQGSVYMSCSLAASDKHVPQTATPEW
jgi:type II secretory pathway pseudopilin PulG